MLIRIFFIWRFNILIINYNGALLYLGIDRLPQFGQQLLYELFRDTSIWIIKTLKKIG